ncbi:hypothetical protein APA_2263 [Pseudanabaena sp. lw0831]|nr:hypothetical protein APA_2263 [Pseudanabaena sp. lw0831]
MRPDRKSLHKKSRSANAEPSLPLSINYSCGLGFCINV